MTSDDMSEFHRLLRQLGVYQAQINAELARAKPNHAKIAKAFAAGKDFAQGCGAVLSPVEQTVVTTGRPKRQRSLRITSFITWICGNKRVPQWPDSAGTQFHALLSLYGDHKSP
jgi:hypothetical protein